MDGALSRRLAVALGLVASSMACSGGGGGDAGSQRPATVEQSLAALGVDTTPTPRVADQATQAPLPDDYSPFGAAQTLNKFDELLAIGFQVPAYNTSTLVTVLDEHENQSSPGTFTTGTRQRFTAATTSWAASSGAAPTTLRAATAGDVDGDGLDELLVVSHTAGDAAVVLRTIQDQPSQWTMADPVEVSSAVPASLALAAGDFDGDGSADVVVAVGTAADVQLVFLAEASGTMALTGKTITLTPVTASPALEVGLAAGNLDHDRAQELAVVVNERFQAGASDSGTSRYWVYDDARTGFAARRQAQRVSATVGGAVRSALVASVAVGDVDGDNVGEVVLGGLTSFDPGGTCAYAYLLLALDGLDASPSLASLGASYQRDLFPAGSDCTALRMRTLHLLAFDRDGDGADEIQANQLSYEDFRQRADPGIPPEPWTTLTQVDPAAATSTLHELFGGSGSTYAGEFSRATSAFAAGDVTRDERADLVVYSQLAAAPAVRVHAISTPPASADPETWREAISIPAAASPAEPLWPILVAANVDHDSMAIRFSQAERRVVFTEPIVIAALAAPPCATDLGQDLDACRTSFGIASSTTTEAEQTWNVTAGVAVGATGGVNVFGIKFETEVTATIKGSYAKKSSSSYTLTKTVTNTTGPLEDAVIFTSIPYDQFTYRILSHWNPEYIGTEVVVSLPRAPIETMVERSFFNANVPAGSIQIDDSVFQHVLGQPETYPTAAEKDALVAAKPELSFGPIDVCQGGGERSLEIVLGTALGGGDTWGVEAELEVKATAGGVIGGFSIGGGYESSLQVTQGTDTSYAGAVSCMASDRFNAGTFYKFGIMSYIHDHPKQPFEVVNYWVE
jgi:hypothetical protein